MWLLSSRIIDKSRRRRFSFWRTTGNVLARSAVCRAESFAAGYSAHARTLGLGLFSRCSVLGRFKIPHLHGALIWGISATRASPMGIATFPGAGGRSVVDGSGVVRILRMAGLPIVGIRRSGFGCEIRLARRDSPVARRVGECGFGGKWAWGVGAWVCLWGGGRAVGPRGSILEMGAIKCAPGRD